MFNNHSSLNNTQIMDTSMATPINPTSNKSKQSSSSPLSSSSTSSSSCCSTTTNNLCGIFSFIYSFFRGIFIVLQNLYHIPTYLFFNWIIFYPLYFIKPSFYNWIENKLYTICLYTVGSWSWLANISVVECGDDIYRIKSSSASDSCNNLPSIHDDSCEKKGKILVIANHQCTADVPLMFQALMTKDKFVLLWVMDYQFKYTNFGVVSATHGDYFISPRTFVKSELTKHCLTHPDKEMIILFPEGGFRYKRAESSAKYAEKNGWPDLNYLTWPRTGAFLDLLEGELHFSHIVDLTFLYQDQETVSSIIDIILGRNPQTIYFHYRVFPMKPDTNYDEAWLNTRWAEKESLMKSFYEDPDEFLKNQQLRPVTMSMTKLLLNNVIVLIGFSVMCAIFYFLISVFI